MRWMLCCGLMGSWSVVALAQETPPRVLDDRLKLELFAEQPQIVTPTGIDVDAAGRVWAIESNTHFPPEGYQGHPTDRVLVMEDTDGDHRADKVTTFLDGLTHTMSVAVRPGWVAAAESGEQKAKSQNETANSSTLNPQLATIFLATRREILLCTDTDGDLKCDSQSRLVHLETAGNYPHNGLAGFAFDALGWMYFGFGENLGADYTIIGSDGTTLSGGGEGGNIYRCRPDGTKLEQWATGFWNPHANCFDAFGRLFSVDNDPDSRPPCRLLHIIQGGDYGYRFRNGRKGTHPFTAWNGEIPGTLPMVAGTGEAPSGIVCYESDGFPEDYQGALLVGSWGDHRIDLFRLKPKGASFTSTLEPVVVGGENFRPVGLAVGPDGALYFTDWVLRDYKLHGKGRVWRLSAKEEPRRAAVVAETAEALRAQLNSRRLVDRRKAASELAARFDQIEFLKGILKDANASARSRVEALWAIARSLSGKSRYPLAFTDESKLAPFGGKFDEMIVAAADLVGTQIAIPVSAVDNPEIYWFAFSSASHVDQSVLNQFQLSARRISDFEGFNPLKLVWEQASEHVERSSKSHVDAYLDQDPFLASADISAFAERANGDRNSLTRLFTTVWTSSETQNESSEKSRLAAILTTRRVDPRNSAATVRLGLTDPSPMVRRTAVQWVGEEKLSEFRWLVEANLASEPMTKDLFLACLATLQLLDGKPASEFEKTPPTQYMLEIVNDDRRSPGLRARALAMLPAGTPELGDGLLKEFLHSSDANLKRETVRTLQLAPRTGLLPEVLRVAADPGADVNLRAEAVGGLCGVPHEEPLPADIEQLLLQYASGDILISDKAVPEPDARTAAARALQEEAIRGLRGRGTAGSKIGAALAAIRKTQTGDLAASLDVALGQPGKEPALADVLAEAGDAERGRRVFFHHNGPLCARCHTVEGRGGNVGPDLSVIARTMDRKKLAESIFEPSREISPQFITWVVVTEDGKTVNGIIVKEAGNGDLEIGNARGEVTLVKGSEIEERLPSKVSVMPEGLHKQMTTEEFRDLLTYLEGLK